MRHASTVTLALTAFLATAAAHSWLECTDYRVTPGSDATKIWDRSLCFGNARCGQRQATEGFGHDTGFNYHSGTGCQCARDQGNYANIAKAVYTPGQRVCLAYPSKNHVAAPCTNEHIPDTGVIITRSARNPTVDDNAVEHKYAHANGEHVTGSVDYKGFQNCPNFCSNMDKALCTMCFDLEADLAPGKYTFRWIWSFNSGDDTYSSCWEAEVRGDGKASPTAEPGKVHPPTDDAHDIPIMNRAPVPATTTSAPPAKAPNEDELECDDEPSEELDCDDEEPEGEELDCDDDDHEHGHKKGGANEDGEVGHEFDPVSQHEVRAAEPVPTTSTPTTAAPVTATPTPTPTEAAKKGDTRCGVVKD